MKSQKVSLKKMSKFKTVLLALPKRGFEVYITSFLAVLFFVMWFFNGPFCEFQAPGFSSMGKSPIRHKDLVSPGYTLFNTIGISNSKSTGLEKIYLVDMYGKEVHSWDAKLQPRQSLLKQDGKLLVSLMPSFTNVLPDDNQQLTKHLIRELDWNSNIIWEYENDLMHHDFEPLPNGNLALIIYDNVPKDIGDQVRGGIQNPDNNEQIISDSIIEVDRNGIQIWKWNLWDHLDPEKDIIGDFDLHTDWTHSNSIRYIHSNPINQEPGYLISVRNLNFIAIISRKTGEIIWRSPKGMLDHQHDATLLDNGNILVFDNGFSEQAKTETILESRVKEIDPRKNEIKWQFKGSDILERSHFFNSTLGGAQKLNNGNVLITMGINGQMIEVTRDQKIVWDYINPYNIVPNGKFPKNYIYKARRIYKDEINWPVNLPPPAPYVSTFCSK